MGCLSISSQQQRTAIADKTLENKSQVQASAKEIQAENRDDVLRHPSSDKRHKINFPPASSGKQWEDLDSKIVLTIDSLLRKSILEHKLATSGDIVYQTCLDTFGAKQHQTKCPPQRSRRQLEMDTLHREELETHLKRTYSDPTLEIPLEETTGLVWPAAPGIKFDSKPPSLQKVIAVVNKARAKSAPGPNGVPYLLYKRCPNVIKKLHKILRSAWKKIKISKEWMTTEGVNIPKELDSRGINQFRPISLLNVEGKLFFSVMASRLTKYLTENGYINTSVQKGGIPGVSGCLEHAIMIWEAIQSAKSEKLNLDVIWLDLANAYGSVLHEMTQLALRMYHVQEVIQVMLDDYFSGFRMRFSTNNYTTRWINLEVGIAMECTISPILFVMAMEVILKAAEGIAGPANLGGGCSMPPLKAFMDDTTINCS
ncbi:reverse transcriptase [Plakobranchus ocellatus]|uniref:Reverse transcriptase n=1 Tax=Plakobranchus ocellatus TaxID=259542 RepID=A0AAV4CCS7_9GAST|nr:reverse transcriptase [Plakobranchus ocellatus]